MSARISPSLADRLRSAPSNDTVDVVVELTPSPGDGETCDREVAIVDWRANFDERAARVAAFVEELGGQVMAVLWLDETLRVSVQAKSVDRLAAVPGVDGLDVPRRLRVD